MFSRCFLLFSIFGFAVNQVEIKLIFKSDLHKLQCLLGITFEGGMNDLVVLSWVLPI